jgi:hypothetical protein
MLAAVLVALGAVAVLHALAGTSLAHVAEGGTSSRTETIRTLGAVLIAAAVAVAMAARSSRQRRVARIVWPAFAVALVLAMCGDQLDQWRWTGAAYARTDAAMARYGVKLRTATPPGAAVAVVWAGAISYFDHRPSVDLLGKSDPVVAHGSPHPGVLFPGHMKWDYAHSIGDLRPGVIAQLWRPTPADLALVRRAGYRHRALGGVDSHYLFLRRAFRTR